VPAGDRAAFRRLARRRTPAWAPHPQPGAAADAIDAPEAAAAAASAQAAETAGSAGLAAAEAEPAVGDPLASVEDFRPLQPEAIKAAMAGSPPGGALSAHVADNGSSGGADAAASSGSSGIAGSSGNGAAVDIAMAVASGGGGCESSILMADRSGNGAAEQPPHAGADAVAASDSAARAVAADAAGNTALSVAESTPQQLAARVDLRVSLNVPPVLRVVPRPLLGYASKLLPLPCSTHAPVPIRFACSRLCLFPRPGLRRPGCVSSSAVQSTGTEAPCDMLDTLSGSQALHLQARVASRVQWAWWRRPAKPQSRKLRYGTGCVQAAWC